MGLNASAAFNFLNLNNNPYTAGKTVGNSTPATGGDNSPIDTAGTVGSSDGTYNMPSGSIYDTAGTMAYNYYNNSFSKGSNSAEAAGTIASSETAGSIASNGGFSGGFSGGVSAAPSGSSSVSSSGSSGGSSSSVA